MRQVEIKFDPFPQQIGPLICEDPITVLICGARGGKTKCGAPRMLYDGIEQKDYHPDDIAEGKAYTMVIGAPTFPQLQRVVLPEVLSACPKELMIAPYHQTRKLLKIRGLKGQTHIYFLSGHAPESWMGMSLYRAWFDEFPRVKEQLFDEMKTRLLDRNGKLLLTGTPQGPNWAYHRLFKPWEEWQQMTEEEKEIDPDHPGSEIAFFRWKTADNPYIPRKFIEHARRTMPKKYFLRTFEATFDTFEGQVYEEFLQQIHVKKRSDYRFKLPSGRMVGRGENLVPLVRVVAGVDWGFALGHAGVIIVAGKDTAGRWWFLEESVDEGVLVKADIGVDSWVTRALNLRVKWEIETFYCDTESPASIRLFRDAGLPAEGAIKDVFDGIATVAKYLHVDEETQEPMAYFLDDLFTTIDEILFYHWKEGREMPEKVMDNTCDAIRYLVYTAEKRGRFQREPAFQG